MNDLSNGIHPVLATARRHDDTDPQETAEWLDALDGVVAHAGAERAQYLLAQLAEHAARRRTRARRRT